MVFLCSLDISDFLKKKIKVPAWFSWKTRNRCQLEEPAIKNLIDQIFGDALQCKEGECLHYLQVPHQEKTT